MCGRPAGIICPVCAPLRRIGSWEWRGARPAQLSSPVRANIASQRRYVMGEGRQNHTESRRKAHFPLMPA